MEDYMDSLEHRSPEQREAAQMKALSGQVEHAKANAPAYAELLAEFNPKNIRDRKALATLPLTRKEELLEQQKRSLPFGGLAAVTPPELKQVFVSPGPIYEPGCSRNDFWRFARALYAAGFREGQLLHNCFAYHFTPAGAMVESGAHALGCTVFPAGPGQLDHQAQVVNDLGPDGYVGTPSFLKMILEKLDETGVETSTLKHALVSGEALPQTLRSWFDDRSISVQQCYATADLGLIAYESTAREGMIIDEGVIVEIVQPGTGVPVPDGQVGEVVVTSLSPEYPLIRFATGDLSAIMPGTSPCGRTNQRIKGWMGRADQTAKVRGMFVRPNQVAAVVARHQEIIKGRLVIDRCDEQDQMTMLCEVSGVNEELNDAVVSSIREVCSLRGEVEFVAEGSLANDGKVIDDLRPVDA